MYVNQTALDFFGYTKDWALGRHVSDFVPLYMKDTALWPSRVNELRTTKKFYTRRSQLDGHGQLHELEYFVNYAKVHDIEYAITIGNLISEKRRLVLEHHEQTTKRMVAQTFLANVNSELNAPLNNIVGFGNLLQKAGPLNAKQAEYLSYIQLSSKRLLELVNQLLDLEKLENNGFVLEKGPTSLAHLAKMTLDSFAGESLNRDLHYTCEIDPELPTLVLADQKRLGQVLFHLLTNSEKFTEKGDVKVKVEQLPIDQHAMARIKMSVADTGKGIAPEHLTVILESFKQVDESTTREHGGLGLGLTLSKKIIELHGGQLGINSEPNNGTTVFFVIDFEKIA